MRAQARCRGSSRKEGEVSFIRELWAFLRVRKKLWLLPMLLVLGLLVALVLVGGNPAVAPFIYTLF